MSIGKYQIFLKTVELGSFTAAARALNFTQSGVSHAIGALEQELGVTLLVRSHGGVTPTADGRALTPYFQEMCATQHRLEQHAADLRGLDTMLPGMDGFTLLRQLRQGGSRLPVLMLTARSELNDRVRGLDAGADYYLTKPFEPEELLACIRSLLRRGGEDVAADPDTTVFGDLTLHMGTFLLECGGRSVRLSRREYDLMELLMKNGSQIVSKEQLILKVWGYDSAAEDNNVEVYISFLRRKLTHLQSAVRIKTLRMVGYCLEVAS